MMSDEPEVEAAAASEAPKDDADDKPPFSSRYVNYRTLDMNAELNEPELLIKELKKIADAHGDDKRWIIVSRMCGRAEETFQILHKTPQMSIARE